jgi:SAM-dependent methyltransferase
MTGASCGYDSALLQNRVFSFYRAISLDELGSTFKPGDRLLELGCGTGDEAVALARMGARVLLTDISESQVRMARQKIQREGLDALLTARVLATDGLDTLARELGEGAFDGAFSSFGALNCAPGIERLPRYLHALIRPDGHFLCSVMNRTCAWEIFSGLASLRPGRAFRRMGEPAASIDGVPNSRVNVRYFTPFQIADIFRPRFQIESMRHHPMLPPPYLDGVFRHFPGYLEWASRKGDGALRGLGDHMFIRMKRLTLHS